MHIVPRATESRREFFRAGARYGLIGLLSAVAWLVARPGALRGQRCVNQGICGSCGAFAECGLPQALSAKLAKRKG